jgi:hypothetical protein
MSILLPIFLTTCWLLHNTSIWNVLNFHPEFQHPMFKKILLTPIVLFHIICFGQNLTGEELINKSIAYHDPNNSWSRFAGDLNITMETPNRAPRVSTISLDLQKQYFKNEYGRDGNTITQEIKTNARLLHLPLWTSNEIKRPRDLDQP